MMTKEQLTKEQWIGQFVAHMVRLGFEEKFSTMLACASYDVCEEENSFEDMTPEEWADEEIYAMAT